MLSGHLHIPLDFLVTGSSADALRVHVHNSAATRAGVPATKCSTSHLCTACGSRDRRRFSTI